MFSSRRSKLSNADSAPGESLFDFLRRKKRVSLEDSFIESRKQCHQMSFSNIDVKQDDQEPERALTTRIQTNKKNVSSNITPKKVSFVDSEQKRQTARTFIDMISPLKSKPSKIVQRQQEDSSERQGPKSILSKKKTDEKQFNRRQFNKSLQVLIETVKNLIKVGKGIKQKSHSLFIDMKPVFKVAEESTNKIIKKKVEEARQKLRVMQHQFHELDIENQNEIIENFHRTLSEHLMSIQSKNRTSYEKIEMDNFMKIKNEKDTKINELMDQNRSLSQNVNILQRKIEKLQQALESTKQREQQKLENYQINNQQKQTRLKQSIAELEKERDDLLEHIKQLQKQNNQKDKKIKDAVYTKEATERRLMEENEKAKSAREEFLLNQIMMIKKQFQNDLHQLTSLYAAKQQDHLLLIDDQKRQLKQMKDFYELNKETQKKVIGQAESLRGVVNKYRKQNQCLVTDMHRMNEQLYQHWLALKDIKTLASRLHLMPKFARIFEDLAFNDLLFS